MKERSATEPFQNEGKENELIEEPLQAGESIHEIRNRNLVIIVHLTPLSIFRVIELWNIGWLG